MKSQWILILGIVFALIVAIFAVVNVEPVTVNYFLGTAEWPLILVILGSVFMGGVIIGAVGLFRMYSLQKQVKTLTKENAKLVTELKNMQEKATKSELESVPESEPNDDQNK